MSILNIRKKFADGGLDSGYYQYTPNYSGLQQAYLEHLGNQSKGSLNSIYKNIFKEPEDFYTSYDEKGNEIKIPVDPLSAYRLTGFDPTTGQRSTTGETVPVTKAEYFNKEVLDPNLFGMVNYAADPESYLGYRQGISDLINSDFASNTLKYENLYPGYSPRTLKNELENALSTADSAQLNFLKKNNPKLYDQLMTGVDPNYARYTPFTARRGEDIFNEVLGKDQSIHDYLSKQNKLYGLSTDELFNYKPYKILEEKNEIPTVDPFSGQQVSAQDQTAFTQPQADIFPQQESTGLNYLMGMPDSDPSPVSNLGRQDILNLLTSNFNNLDLQTMNEIRNNPGSFTIENPYLQAARTGIQSLSPGKVMSDVGEGLSTIYHGTADPSKAFSGSKFFATPDYQTALQYAKEGALRGTSIGNATGDVLRATAPTSQIQDLLKRGLTGTREIVLDPQAAQKLFLQGSGNLVETGSLASRLGRKAFQALPAVGAGLAGLDAYQRFNQGDYIGAGLGAASAIPGIGLPATAAQILYDVVYKPNQRN